MKKNEEVLSSLNEELSTEFSIKQLEERLETDPLLLGNPVDASIQMNSAECFTCSLCFCFTCSGEFVL
ncbi:hypothetical protein [Bacteroides acidifaciens]|mgnify:CR=1 FL=1|uniref:hypothetical protein n=1 Tax=Bacteroides acidifaciens TaxID=85831 RepID=UPI0024309018|nr:hypothetical protein [Bacteroides acidifaciens]